MGEAERRGWSEPYQLESGEILAPVPDAQSERGFKMQTFRPGDPEYEDWLDYLGERRSFERSAPSDDDATAPVSSAQRIEVSPVGVGIALTGALAMTIAVFLPRVESASFIAGVAENSLIQSGGRPRVHRNRNWDRGCAQLGSRLRHTGPTSRAARRSRRSCWAPRQRRTRPFRARATSS